MFISAPRGLQLALACGHVAATPPPPPPSLRRGLALPASGYATKREAGRRRRGERASGGGAKGGSGGGGGVSDRTNGVATRARGRRARARFLSSRSTVVIWFAHAPLRSPSGVRRSWRCRVNKATARVCVRVRRRAFESGCAAVSTCQCAASARVVVLPRAPPAPSLRTSTVKPSFERWNLCEHSQTLKPSTLRTLRTSKK